MTDFGKNIENHKDVKFTCIDVQEDSKTQKRENIKQNHTEINKIKENPKNNEQKSDEDEFKTHQGLKHKAFSASFLSICKTSIKYFSVGKYKKLKLFILFTMIAIKTIGNSLCKYFISTSDGESKKQMVAVIIGSILLGTSHSFNFFVDWLFEKYLCRYKEKISINCLRKIFNSDDLKINDISPNKTAHIIEDGGEAMAEVSKSLLLDLPNVILKFLCDTIIIFFTDDSGSKKIYTIFFVGGLLLLALKLYIITYSVKYVKPLVLEGLERDKIFHEIMDRDKIIRSFCVDEEYLKKLRDNCRRWANMRKKHNFSLMAGEYIYRMVSVLYQILVCLIFLYASKESTKMTVGCLFLFLLEIIENNEDVAKLFEGVTKAISEAEMIMVYLYLTQEDTENLLSLNSSCLKNEIVFKNVSYAIKDEINEKECIEIEENPNVIFKDVNFKLKKGEKVALTGKNGSGKSTIMKSLLNIVDFQGSIEIDGISNKTITRRSLYKMITYVPQNTILMNDTILFNIMFFNKEATYEEVESVCKELDIHHIIMRFPKGYHSEVGPDGKNLNGSLRQKIFYARAFLRNSPVYLFDEPDNNLDAGQGIDFIKYVLKSERFREKLVFVITHEMNLVNLFDKKLFLENKKIVLLN